MKGRAILIIPEKLRYLIINKNKFQKKIMFKEDSEEKRKQLDKQKYPQKKFFLKSLQ